MKGNENKIIIWLVIVCSSIVFTGWLVWQKHHWQDYFSSTATKIEETDPTQKNYLEIKSEINQIRKQWEQAKQHFQNQLSYPGSTSSTSTSTINPEVVAEMKNIIEAGQLESPNNQNYAEETNQ